jgi:hypothetical protein
LEGANEGLALLGHGQAPVMSFHSRRNNLLRRRLVMVMALVIIT